MAKKEKKITGSETGVHLNAVDYADNIVLGARQGHGFAAEKGNHLIDVLKAKDAALVGGNNARNGPDRLVEGKFIQSKYCATGKRSIANCFDKKGNFRYLNADGTPMLIEVAFDNYDEAIIELGKCILEGKIPGFTNPASAVEIVKQGSLTQKQAVALAKAGSIEGMHFDVMTGSVTAIAAFGVSSLVAFARGVWNGEDTNIALKEACKTGLYIGGITIISHVVAQQFIRAGADKALRGVGGYAVNNLGSRMSSLIAKTAGYDVSGGAAKNVANKIIRGHIVVGVATTLVLSSADIVRMFQGKISGKQLFKNIAKTGAGVAGGTAGWLSGAALGAQIGTVYPGIGTAIGGFVGGLIGGFSGGAATSYAASAILDGFIEDDADEMLAILQERLKILAHDYVLTNTEAEYIVDFMSENQSDMFELLQRMFSSSSSERVADDFLMPLVEAKLRERAIISSSSSKTYVSLKNRLVKSIKWLAINITSARFYLRGDGYIKRKLLIPAVTRMEGLRYYQAAPSIKEYGVVIEGVFEEMVDDGEIIDNL